MIPHAPADATFPSLVLGLLIGCIFSIVTFIGFTQANEWRQQFERIGVILIEYGLMMWIVVTCLSILYVRVGWRTLKKESKLKAAERLSALKRNISHLPAHFPNGWYKLCDSDEIPIATTRHVQLLNKDVAMFRAAGEKKTGAGRGLVHVLDAYCPHLGANMGHEGKVEENNIVCPFHGWQFNGPTGTCMKIPYATKIPATAKALTWDSCEINGSIFLWYDVDYRPPTWSIPSMNKHSSNNPKHLGTFHGRILLDVPGNIQELVNKHADEWSGELISTQRPPSVFGFNWRWSSGKKSWIHSPTNSEESTLSTSAQLTFFGITLPFSHFLFHLHHIGPSILYTRIQPVSVLLKFILGSFMVHTSFRPDTHFVNTVEWTIYSLAPTGGLIGWFHHFLFNPLQRAFAKLVLLLFEYRFETLLPLFTLKELQLSLYNSGGAKDAFKQPTDEDEETDEVESETSSSTLTSRASVRPITTPSAIDTSASSTPPSQTKKKSIIKGYSSTSDFYSTFWRGHYSKSGIKKQDNLTW